MITTMKRMLLAFTVMMGLAATPANAQGLGGLLKKAKKAVEKIASSATTATETIAGKGTTVKLDKYQFPDVRKSAKIAQVLSLGISTDYNHTGLLTLRNVPVQWDVEPE